MAQPSTKNARKVARLLEVTADQSLKQALNYIHEAYDGQERAIKPNTLKSDLDSRVLALHTQFLKAFSQVDAQFGEVSSNVEKLSVECTAAKQELNAVALASRDLMATVETLQAELEEVKAREEHVTSFMSQFQLTREESDILKEDVSPRFLEVVNKIYHIRERCLHIPEEQAAIEIRETLYLTQVGAIEKLSRHLTHNCSELFSGDHPEVSDFFVQAMLALAPHPGSWMKVAQEIARVRRTSVIRRFLNLLTALSTTVNATSQRARGHSGGASSAMDPVRLCGDLCAWLHTTIAEDSDCLSSLFASSTVNAMTKADVLDLIFEGVCRHLRERMNQALAECGCNAAAILDRPDPAAMLVLFRLEGLLGFYSSTTEALLGANASLTECIRSMRLEALKVFFEALQSAMRKTLSASSVVQPDLGVSPEAQATLRLLKLMMDHLQSSFVPQQQRESDFAAVLGAIVDPLISLTETAELPSTVSAENRVNSREVHKMNTICAILSILVAYDFAAAKEQRLTSQLEEVVLRFIDANSVALRVKFGLEERLQQLQHHATQPVDKSSVADTASTLFSYIYNVEALTVSQLEFIQVLRIRDRLRVEITRNVCDAYTAMYDMARQVWGPEEAAAVLPHDPQQLRVLLDVA